MLSLCCFCLCLLRGQDNDLSLVNGVGVHKMVGVAREDGLVLHRIAIGRLGDSTQRIAVSGGGGGNKPVLRSLSTRRKLRKNMVKQQIQGYLFNKSTKYGERRCA